VQWSPRTVVNFTTGAFSACLQRATEPNDEPRCPPGDLAVIFGQWLSSRNFEDGQNLTSFTKHTVDCRVSYGTVELEQDSFGPRLKRRSFVKSKAPIGKSGSLASLWQSGFLGESGLNYSPYTFAYTTSDLNTMTPLIRYLIPLESSPDANDTARVGQTIEATQFNEHMKVSILRYRTHICYRVPHLINFSYMHGVLTLQTFASPPQRPLLSRH
jgi:hypothetical protein